MKLIKQKSREYQGKAYYKYILNIPTSAIEEIGWEGGEELNCEVEDGKLVIQEE